MSRRYRHPIRVHLKDRHPQSFTWRGAAWHVRSVLATWHLRDRWWASGPAEMTETPAAAQTESDRLYYRLDCAEGVVEIYHDLASGLWVLDCVYD